MKSLKIILLAGAAIAASVGPVAHAQTAPAEASQDEAKRLNALFAADDEASLKRNPLSALFRGDLRYADRIGDFGTDAYNDAERAAAQKNLTDLATIDRGKLNATDKIAYDVFKYNQEQTLRGLTPEILALTDVRPINHFFGIHTFYPTFASGKGAAPFKTVLDYENNLKRHQNFVEIIDRSIARFKQGQQSGVVETQLTIKNVIEQLDTQLKIPVDQSPYFGPVGQYPADFNEADKTRLTAAYRASITDGLYPSLARLRDYLRDDYIKSARPTVGLSQMKGGAALYALAIDQTTTLPLTADEIHNTGLAEVARIKKGMEEVKTEVAFKGTLAEFFNHLRTDPKFKASSREDLTQRFYDIAKQVDAKVPEYFSNVPKSKLEIRPL